MPRCSEEFKEQVVRMMMPPGAKSVALLQACLRAAILVLLCIKPVAAKPTEVTLQLLWDHQFQFAGYYAAEAKGFYAEEGLSVTLKDGGYNATGQSVNPVEEVVFGRADFGVTRSDLLLERMLGLPVVAMASIFQRSPFVLLTTASSGIRSLEDIGQKPVMLELPGGEDGPRRIDVETLAMLKHAGIDYRQLNNIPPSWDYRDLVTGKTSLMPGYITDTPLIVRRAGAQPIVINPLDHGIDFYGDVLFTSEHMRSLNPDLVARFRRASLRGWRYALAHPEEVVALILQRYYPDAGPETREFLEYEARRTVELVQSDLFPVGFMSRERWERIGQTFVDFGLVSGTPDLDSFLYEPGEPGVWERFRFWLLGAAGLFVVVLAVLITVVFLNHRLRRQITEREQLEVSLKEANRKLLLLSDTDALTKLHNRRYVDESLTLKIKEAERYDEPLAVALIDVDHFKRINDTFGHARGDSVLVAIAEQIRKCIREVDLAGRYGGEEFLLAFPKLKIQDAANAVERLRLTIKSITIEGLPGQVTISAGVVAQRRGEPLSRLVSRADKLLYQAKRGGRNRIVFDAEATERADTEPTA